jgi:hypothetical protein
MKWVDMSFLSTNRYTKCHFESHKEQFKDMQTTKNILDWILSAIMHDLLTHNN